MEMKLCKDCVHCRRGILFYFDPSMWRCAREPRINRVNGETVIKKFCDLERTSFSPFTCQPAGQYFEPK